jgi:calcineurin-like phosphoesterase family protein
MSTPGAPGVAAPDGVPHTGPRRWFSSDQHFGHRNILEFAGRPFRSVDHMNTALIDSINTAVPAGDELWLLGDLALGPIEASLSVLRRIAADLVLVLGNHDRPHPYNGRKAEGWADRYLKLTGAARLEPLTAALTLTDGTDVTASHFPYPDPGFRPYTSRGGKLITTDKFTDWRPADTGGWLLCGHVHQAWRQRGRQINVGVDAWAGRPVPESVLVELIAAGPADRGPLPWA